MKDGVWVQMQEGLLLIVKASIYIPLLCTFLCVLSMLQFWARMGEGDWIQMVRGAEEKIDKEPPLPRQGCLAGRARAQGFTQAQLLLSL